MVQSAVDFYRENLISMLSAENPQYKTEPEIYEEAKKIEVQQMEISYAEGSGKAYSEAAEYLKEFKKS